MDPVEQPTVAKFLFLKGFGYNTADRELCSVLLESTDSLS
jgi:hypothetical protein